MATPSAGELAHRADPRSGCPAAGVRVRLQSAWMAPLASWAAQGATDVQGGHLPGRRAAPLTHVGGHGEAGEWRKTWARG
ncbi:unnamed protein product [Rangifer tarandus platyrhynchus]|uniref:Uncharacterized protein n=2 Tax=Rangifer tarandus platyrhynchus TaxID=3082113 RepID=A0ABN8ZFJ8_RANTA|nr:unnamed protein product [Rangifer tarandus platyrhynchus]CAI9707483.1 unnamed protein product [Rangifer tarandus platyrhynchus]